LPDINFQTAQTPLASFEKLCKLAEIQKSNQTISGEIKKLYFLLDN